MRLLLAEDEIELSNALVAIFKHSNYSVDAVYNGEDALDYLLTGNYDCAILDIMMPLLDGISVLKKARENNISTPILILTAKSEINDKILGLDSGADDYLSKPFDSKELLARIRALLRRNTNQVQNDLKYGNLILNTLTFELSNGTDTIKLQNKEFQMLEMLMINPNKIISVETFMEKIWGYDTDTELNVVWVYISNLRKKLIKLNSSIEIKASRNIGYYLALKWRKN